VTDTLSSPLFACGQWRRTAVVDDVCSRLPGAEAVGEKSLVLITVDALRHDALGCTGSASVSTPSLDGFAGSGVLCDHSISNGPRTQASFPSIMCSLYPLVAGERRGLPAAATTLAEAIRSEGYATAGFNPSNPFLTRETGYDRGFELFIDFWDVHDRTGSGRRKGPWAATKKSIHDAMGRKNLGFLMLFQALVQAEGGQYLTGSQITEQALAWLADRRGPFFLWLHFMDVHYPYQPLPGERSWRDRMSYFLGMGGILVGRPKAAARSLRRLYDRRVELVDGFVGEFLAGLAELGLDASTAVAITSDHGEQLGERGRYAHGPDLHDELLRVPLLIRDPDLDGGQICRQQVPLLDLGPTLLDLLQIQIPDTFLGSSLVPLLHGATRSGGTYVFSESMHSGARSSRMGVADVHRVVSCRGEGWKYIRDDEGPREELYDLERDPAETTNLAEARPQDLARFRVLVEEHDRLVAREAAKFEDTGEQPISPDDEAMRRRLAALGYL
jgi:arylsulfatase A-like enzyme